MTKLWILGLFTAHGAQFPALLRSPCVCISGYKLLQNYSAQTSQVLAGQRAKENNADQVFLGQQGQGDFSRCYSSLVASAGVWFMIA